MIKLFITFGIVLTLMHTKSIVSNETFFTDCGNGEITKFQIGHCSMNHSSCSIPLNTTFVWHYAAISNQQSKSIIANLTIIEKLIYHNRIDLCKHYPEIASCPILQNKQYDNELEIKFNGHFYHDQDHISMVPVGIDADIYGDQGQLACFKLRFNITKHK